MRIIYVLAKETFFAIGPCGSVSHAVGVADTLAQSGHDITVLSGPQTAEYIQHAKVVEVERGSSRNWYASLMRELDAQLHGSTDATTVIVRYGVSNSFRFISRMRRSNPAIMWCFEVNSLAYHQYPGLPTWIRRMALAVESRIVGQAHCSYLISDVLRQDIEPAVRIGHRCLVVPNGGPAPVHLPAAKAESAFRFVYFGRLANYNHLDVMIEGFVHARAQGLVAQLHIYGDGPQLEKVQSLARQDDNITVHGRYALKALLANELNESKSVLLLPFGDSGGLNRVQSPIKLFEYMSTGLPIIASDMPQIRLTLDSDKCAVLVDPRSAVAWGESMLGLELSARRRELMTNELRRIYPAFTWEQRMVQLLEGLQKHFKATRHPLSGRLR